MRILLAEDDKILADALGRALTRSAYAVDVTHTGSKPSKRSLPKTTIWPFWTSACLA